MSTSEADVVIHHAEGHRAGRSVFVAQNLLGVEEIDALILSGLTAEGKAVKGGLQNGLGLFAVQRAVEDARLAVLLEDILARLGAEIHDLTLIHNHHALAVRHRDDAAVGNHVVILVAAAAEAALDLFLRLRRQHIVRQRIHVKIFLPLAGERAAGGVQCCCNQSHMSLPSSLFSSLQSLSEKRILHKPRARNARPYGYAVAFLQHCRGAHRAPVIGICAKFRICSFTVCYFFCVSSSIFRLVVLS